VGKESEHWGREGGWRKGGNGLLKVSEEGKYLVAAAKRKKSLSKLMPLKIKINTFPCR